MTVMESGLLAKVGFVAWMIAYPDKQVKHYCASRQELWSRMYSYGASGRPKMRRKMAVCKGLLFLPCD